MDKKFNINGRETEWYYLSLQEKIDLIRSEETNEEDKKFLLEKLLDRIQYDFCPKTEEGETEDDVFARLFSDYVNRSGRNFDKATDHMCREHRYLQNQMFKVCLSFIKKLAERYERGCYDPRNKWACETSKKMIDHLIQIDWWF